MSADLVTWLRQQIAEDRQRAEAAAVRAVEQEHPPLGSEQYVEDAKHWSSERWLFSRQPVFTTSYARTQVAERTVAEVSDHIANWDPARVLAECDAKERILAEIERELADDDTQATPQWMLRVLALPYTDRSGYLDEWRVDAP